MHTFAQLDFFREFYEYGQHNLVKDEKLFKKTLLERQRHKQAFLTYCSQIGKLKGLNLAIQKGNDFGTNAQGDVLYKKALKARQALLMQRLQKIDF